MPITEKQTVAVNSGFAHPADTTKQVQFDMSGITANSPAVVTVPNASGTMALTNGFKFGSFTRDLTDATGSVTYTGVGFTPSRIEFFGGVDVYATLNGVADGVNNYSLYQASGTTVGISGTKCITLYYATGPAAQEATLASFDANGFTLSWIKTGSPSQTATIFYRAYR